MPNGTVATFARIAIVRPRASRHPRSHAAFVLEATLVLAFFSAGFLFCLAALLFAVVAAPLVAAAVLFTLWRCDETEAARRTRRMRARVRRARALGLRILAS
jgi:hypothetical protein